MTDTGVVLTAEIAGTIMSVLDIPELCEMVFSHIEISHDLFRAISINRRTRSLALGTLSIRKRLFLAQHTRGSEECSLWSETTDTHVQPNMLLNQAWITCGDLVTTTAVSNDSGTLYNFSLRRDHTPEALSGIKRHDWLLWFPEGEILPKNARAESDLILRFSIHRNPETSPADDLLTIPEICLDMFLADHNWPVLISVDLEKKNDWCTKHSYAFASAGTTLRDVLAWTEKFAETEDANGIEVGGVVELTKENYTTVRQWYSSNRVEKPEE